MNRFRFQLEPLLRFRRHRRDLCRQVLAQLVADDRALAAQQQAVERSRAELLDELRGIGKQGEVDVDRAVTRRDFAGQLVADAKLLQHRKTLLAAQLELCRQALLKSDQEVKAIEKLEDQRRAEFEYQNARRGQQMLEDAWSAARRRGPAR
jgi:flagellar FliJ protein